MTQTMGAGMTGFRIVAASLIAALFAAPAFAHTLPEGHNGFEHGVAHMFSGVDHLALAFLVGVWASADVKGRGLSVLAAYGAALLGSGLLGVALPGAAVDGALLALIVAAAAMLLIARLGWGARLASALVIAMAATQGFAHVADLGGDVAPNAEFVAGLAAATILVAAAFAAAAHYARRRMASRHI